MGGWGDTRELRREMPNEEATLYRFITKNIMRRTYLSHIIVVERHTQEGPHKRRSGRGKFTKRVVAKTRRGPVTEEW